MDGMLGTFFSFLFGRLESWWEGDASSQKVRTDTCSPPFFVFFFRLDSRMTRRTAGAVCYVMRFCRDIIDDGWGVSLSCLFPFLFVATSSGNPLEMCIPSAFFSLLRRQVGTTTAAAAAAAVVVRGNAWNVGRQGGYASGWLPAG
ncbi:hypothetical protein B0J12DRAFT_124414 [Macrophomina phaseolina]|uniref:Secreted protein n=1 Tax=Macrophomina phaseolina TaxID=35725 RepID=A0ABQ8G7W8_9PEZI|nr:hypothetical protein B0J12DRAFT_124414 [Macrophomina phaseolina]